jgi:hypothetical protein
MDARPLVGARGHVLAGITRFDAARIGRTSPPVPELAYPLCTRLEPTPWASSPPLGKGSNTFQPPRAPVLLAQNRIGDYPIDPGVASVAGLTESYAV